MGYANAIALILLSGCTPFVEYQHLSQPNVPNDGHEFVCGGIEGEKGNVRVEAAMCENTAPYRGTYGRFGARYLFK